MNGTPATAPTIEEVRAGWDRIAAGFDDHVTPWSMAFCDGVLDRIGLAGGSAFLDVACGSGAFAIPAARRGAHVTAVDLSPVMIDRLTARALEERLDMDARVMDGTELAFDDDRFDVAASQHGVSTFPDLGAGLLELVRVTRPGGNVVLVAFGPLEQAEFISFFIASVRAVAPHSAALPSGGPPLPFQVADPAVLAARLRDAGLDDVRVEPSVWTMELRSASHLWSVVTSSNPIAARVAATLPPEQVTAAQDVLDGMLRERSGGHPGAVLHTGVNVGLGTA